MNAVHVDPKTRRARVQGGATWGDFDREAQIYGLATPGGLVSATGVAGLSLAGGVGWLRGKFGLCLDNIVSVDIVTADGVLRTASEDENAELFWGIRGGGGNFGVVTSFEFQVHPIGPTVMFVAPIYRAADAAKVMKGWRDFMANAPDEIGGMLVEFSTIAADPEYPEEAWGEKVMTLAGVWAGPADEGEVAVQPLRELAEPLLDFSGQMPYCEFQVGLPGRPGGRDHRRNRAALGRPAVGFDAVLGLVHGCGDEPRGGRRHGLRPARHGVDALHRRHLGGSGR
jgi:FAD/FMN-containing dehydrogenase